MPTDPTTDLASEQQHLTESRTQLRRMRDRTASMDASAGGDWVSREYLQSTFVLRMQQLADDPTIPLFFGRLDYADDGPVAGRVPHRPAARQRRRGRADGHRLAGAGQPAVLPGHPRRPDGGAAATTVRVPARDADVVRGRGPDPRAGRGVLRDPGAGDRAAARGPDARHRGHHPARAGRDRALRPVPVDLRAGRTRHRQDGGRPAPGGVPAVRAPRAAHPSGSPGGRARTPASCATSATCCRRSARSTRRSRRSTSSPTEPCARSTRSGRCAATSTPQWPR